MKLSDRDYNQLTAIEIKEWESVKQREKLRIGNTEFKKSLYHDYPKAVRHYLSLFPNNHLDTMLLREEIKLKKLIDEFSKLLDNPSNGEREILNFIKDMNAYFIVGSILSSYNFGHHNAFVFPEFPLGTLYRVDYLAIGRGSGGYEFVFIEFENSYGRIVKNNGEFGAIIRKGISQVSDWDDWIEENFQNMSELLSNLKNPRDDLPKEFYKLDKSRIHYAVVAGRRHNYTEKTYRLRRKERKNKKITLLHYDNLVDYSTNLIGKSTY